MTRGLRLRWACSYYRLGRDDGIRVRFDVVASTGLSSRIFAYRMRPVSPVDRREGFFSHICSPVDLAEYPEDAPVEGDSPEWFRLPYVDVLVRSVTEAENFVQAVREDARRLVATLRQTDTLMPGSEETVGTVADDDSESSSASPEDPDTPEYGPVTFAEAVGTLVQTVPPGEDWTHDAGGAGTEIGDSDSSEGVIGVGRSVITLQPDQVSQLLLVQGFDFSGIPPDARITGLTASVYIRDLQADDSGPASLPAEDCSRLCFLALQTGQPGDYVNKAQHDCLPGPLWGQIAAGGVSDLWGLSQVPGSVARDGMLGLRLGVDNPSDIPRQIEVDGVRLQIAFQERLP